MRRICEMYICVAATWLMWNEFLPEVSNGNSSRDMILLM